MERRMLLAVLLSFTLVTGYMLVTGRCSPPPPEKKPDTPAAAPGAPTNGAAGVVPPVPGSPGTGPGVPAPAPAPAGDPEAPAAGAPAPAAEIAPLANESLRVELTNVSGSISSVTSLHDFETGTKIPLDLVVPVDPTLLMGAIDRQGLEPSGGAPGGSDRAEDPPGALRSSVWTRDGAAEAASAENDVVYVLATASGRTWRKQWILGTGPGRYDLRLRVSVTGAPGPEPLPLRVLASSGLLREHSAATAFGDGGGSMAVLRLATMSEPKPGLDGIRETKPEGNDRVALLGTRSMYFLAAYYDTAQKGEQGISRVWATGEEAARRKPMATSLRTWFERSRGRKAADDPALEARIVEGVPTLHFAWLVADVPADGKALELPFYVGPISREVLKQEAYATIEPVIAYSGAIDAICKVLLWIYDRWRELLGSIGVAILLMTLVVRGALLMPVSIKNQLGMRVYGRKIQKIKPKLDELRKRYANNPRKLREEQIRLQREHGIGFPMGCLMIFAQMFIFFALFSCLRAEYSFRNAPFLWIPDLSGPDRLIDLPRSIWFTIPIVGSWMGEVRSINLLPLLYVVLTIWQTRQMPKPVDEQQAQQMKMMKWLPIVFAVLLYNYTAALALYMILSSLIAVIESKIVKRLDEARQGDGTSGPGEAWPTPA